VSFLILCFAIILITHAPLAILSCSDHHPSSEKYNSHRVREEDSEDLPNSSGRLGVFHDLFPFLNQLGHPLFVIYIYLYIYLAILMSCHLGVVVVI
jgi:hypothetical protein